MCCIPSPLLWQRQTALHVSWDCEAALTAHYTARAAASQYTQWHSCLTPVHAHNSSLLRVLSQYHWYLAMIFTHESNSWRAGSQQILWEKWHSDNSQTNKFLFTHAGKHMLLLNTSTWRRPVGCLWTCWKELWQYSTIHWPNKACLCKAKHWLHSLHMIAVVNMIRNRTNTLG
jgi:hypothetical protein